MEQLPKYIRGKWKLNLMSDDSTFVFETKRLQAYVQDQKDTYLTRPGYEVYFYSRMDPSTAIDPGSLQSFEDILPTLQLQSSTDHSVVCPVTDLQIANSIDGSQATLTIIHPVGIEYFLPTIGDTRVAGNGQPDFDFLGASDGSGAPKHRIGVMDTVLIKLLNIRNDSRDSAQRETVFRGVIAEIHRKESVQGVVIQLSLMDFSEFLRRTVAVNYGFFSTISVSATGRKLVYNALRYVNNLLGGQKMSILQGALSAQDQQNIQNIINSVSNTLASDAIKGQNGQFIQNEQVYLNGTLDAMTVPPFFALEFSDKLQDGNLATGLVNNLKVIAQAAGNLLNIDSNINIDTSLNPNTISPEDAETVPAYKVGITGSNKPNSIASASQDLTARAWVESDLYVDPNRLSFEHEFIWNLISETANRGFREAFVDFKPKLSKSATKSYQNADTVEQRANLNLPDLHPNIAVVKYRLSPALLPYRETHENSAFWMYSFTKDDIISYESAEKEAGVFTHVLAYGFGDGAQTIGNLLNKFSVESKALAFAQPLDPRLTKRIGYRFMADNDAKLVIPFMRGFISYAILEKAQLSMFQQTITIIGRPDIQPGSIVRLIDKKIDYYCIGVSHVWNMQAGYTTQLKLGYGHTQGQLSTMYTGAGTTDTSLSEQQCASRHDVLKPYIKTPVIGDIDVECFVEALWTFWAHSTTSDNELKNYTKEAEEKQKNSGIINPTQDWISLKHADTPNTYDSIISNNIRYLGLDKYNVTLNAVKNLVYQESGFNQFAKHVDIGYGTSYGLFQIEFTNVNPRTDITIDEAQTNIDKACGVALGILLGKFKVLNIQPNCSGNDYLTAFTAYNGGSVIGQYVSDVFGANQVQAIINNSQTPKSASFPSGSTTPWPYFIYGPCGIRVAQAGGNGATNPKTPDANYNAIKNALLHFSTGMSESVKYLTSVLSRYKDSSSVILVQTLSGSEDRFTKLTGFDQKSLFDKAIAAWYSNELEQPYEEGLFSPTHFINIKSQIRQLYDACVSCSKQNEYNLINDYNLNGKGTLASKIYAAALAFKGQDTLRFQDGRNACAASVSYILEQVGLKPIGSLVPGIVQAFDAGRGQRIGVNEAVPGDIWVEGYIDSNFGQNHVGIVVQAGSDPVILSNSSSRGEFIWQDTASAYENYYHDGFPSGYYRVLN